MTETVEVPRDARGFRNTVRRGPKPGSGAGTQTVMLQTRITPALLAKVNEAALAAPHRGSIQGTGKSWVIRQALTLLFEGDAELWRRRYQEERTRRLQVEAKLARVREALS